MQPSTTGSPYTVFVVGGTCSGKTTTVAALAHLLHGRGHRTFPVAEVASSTAATGFRDLATLAPEEHQQVHRAYTIAAVHALHAARALGCALPSSVVVSDRGPLDSFAYTDPFTVTGALETAGASVEDVLALADLVLLLESGPYEELTNTFRYEGEAERDRRAQIIADVYAKHHNVVPIAWATTAEDRAVYAAEVVEAAMASPVDVRIHSPWPLEPPAGHVDQADVWRNHANSYAALLADVRGAPDTAFVREAGVIATVLELCGDASDRVVLDAGCGTGWLHERLSSRKAFACDVADYRAHADHVEFANADLRALPYDDEMFDLVVSSLTLMWIDDLDVTCRELQRVSQTGGQLVLSLTHPFFYHNTELAPGGGVTLTRPLAHERVDMISIADRVGPFPHYYRPPSRYLNALIEAGWRIDDVREWSLDDEAVERLASKPTRSRQSDVPMFMFVAATKA